MFNVSADLSALAKAIFSQTDFRALAKLLAPMVANELLLHPRWWGDPSRVRLGKDVTVANALFNVVSGEVHIGDNTFFGHNVCVLTGTHDIGQRGAARRDHATEGNDIHIGAGVWVASNVTILGPCRIGDDAVIAAGAVVLPGEYGGGAVYAGVPAKLVKRIAFEEP